MVAPRKQPGWSLFGEFVAALAVLALLVLSFGQVTPANSVLSSAAPADNARPVVYCGGGPGDEDPLCSSACHACRFDGAVLPAAPGAAEPAFAALVRPAVPVHPVMRPAPATGPNRARAPPFSV